MSHARKRRCEAGKGVQSNHTPERLTIRRDGKVIELDEAASLKVRTFWPHLRSPWSDLFKAMQRQLAGRDSCRDFHEAQRTHGCLRAYPGPEELVAALHSRRLGPEEEDGLLRSLVQCVRMPEFRSMATAAVWVALRPGLCALLGRLVRQGMPREEAVADIQFHLTEKLDRFTLDLPRPVAASLLSAIEQVVLRQFRSGQRLRTRTVPLEDRHPAPESAPSQVLGLDITVPFDAQVEEIRRRLVPIVGDLNAILVVQVHVLGQSHREAGESHGLTSEAARKRVQRALKKLLEEFPRLHVPIGRTP